ncbi:DUF1549 and DUF1553 domain-containing protein [Pirellulales bacterium]|nr:DUF1549 and DUF1553 domain-containing protein [Pirellulales bacterium]
MTRDQNRSWNSPRRLMIVSVLSSTLCFAASGVTGADAEPAVLQIEKITVAPSEINLSGTRDVMRTLVTGHRAAAQRDLTREATYHSSNEEVVVVDRGIARPIGDGSAVVTVEFGGQRATVPVTVDGAQRPQPISFRYETLSVLTKQGCNSGGCHGAPAGKAGFRLSLFAFDPVLDELTILKEESGRRTNRFDPEASLLLNKPLMKVPHGGGRQLKKGDAAYEVLRDWIAEGCQVDSETTSPCARIEILPGDRILHFPHVEQQLAVLAHFEDGTIRDVTDIVEYFSADETMASVDAHGLVEGTGHGETAIVVRYLEHVGAVRLTFIQPDNGFQWNAPPEHNEIDRLVFAKLRQMQYSPSPLCTDEQFVRRVYLDAIGLLPTIAEAQQFVADEAPDKRTRLVDELLERPEYAQFWATRWGDLLRAKNATLHEKGVRKLHSWLVRAIATNMPYDDFVRQLLLAEGDTFENPPANYYRAAADTLDCTETTAQTFLGLRMKCAKCHNHPYERWTQDNYYGLGAFFNRIQRTEVDPRGAMAIWIGREGEITQPRTGQEMQPWLPGQGELNLPEESDRRTALVDWLTTADNPFLAQVEANRIWSYLMGRGLVDPIDDFRDSNPASNPELLNALANKFVETGFNRKSLIATIFKSRTYQLDSAAADQNQGDRKYFSHYPARRLSAEQLTDAIGQLTLVRETFDGLPNHILATQLPSPDQAGAFMRTMGKPGRNTACECERSNSPDLAQSLELASGELIDRMVRASDNCFRTAQAAGSSIDEIVDQLHWAALSRPPNESERNAISHHFEQSASEEEGLEDLLWAMINSKEFLFQH